jgi:transposase
MKNISGYFFPEKYIVVQRCGKDDGKGYVFELISASRSAICPKCGEESFRTHSYQWRTVRDLPILGEAVTLLISQQKYFCDNEGCEVDIFTERSDFINPYFQFTERCREYMLKVAMLVSSEAAAKILAYQGIKVSGDTLLNIIKAAGQAYGIKPGIRIGVDDWAYRKGQEYGTIICDLDTHEIIDVLEGRDKETFEKWLRGHPDIEIVSRDRASAYASAVTSVLPEAVQIADRFHITKNLLEALNDTMKTYMPEVIEIPDVEPTESINNVEANQKGKKRCGTQAASLANKTTR